jgi:hypothetical protein
MKFPAQRRRLLDNLPAALVMLRGLVNNDDYMAGIRSFAFDRHADAFAVYGSAMYAKSPTELGLETDCELADALVYLSEIAAQEQEQ